MHANKNIKATYLLLSVGTLLLVLLVPPGPTVSACDSSSLFSSSYFFINDHNVHKELSFLDDSGFSFSYPDEFTLYERFRHETPYSEPEKILRRISLVDEQMFLDIDIWLKNGKAITNWLNGLSEIFDYKEVNLLESKTSSDKYTVAAISYTTGSYPSLQLSIEMKDHFVQLNHKFTNDINDLRMFVHIVKSIKLDNNTSLDEIFGTIITVSLENYYTLNQKLIDEKEVIISAERCCGLYSPGNPFQCCDTSSSLGNCTWHVFYMYGGVPFRGNADEWYYQVYITPGWESSNTPPYTSQNIGWHERGDMGHVAYITSHTSTVVSGSEQNWCQAGCPSRFYSRSASFFEKYLYRIRDIIPTSTLLIID